jgi:catechol 2,3-dioxygenase-like lactoylglutathione lyase family enzyme
VGDDLPRLGGPSGVAPLAEEEAARRPDAGVGHVALGAPDLPAAVDFFAALGLRALERREDFGLLELRGGTHLALFPAAAAAAPDTPAPFDLMVDDLDAAHARLAAAGLAPSAIQQNRFHRVFTLRAPSGHVVSIQSSHASGRPV